MNIACLSWNLRGLGRPEKVQSVVKVVCRSRADFVLLQETKLQCPKLGLTRRLKGSRDMGFVFTPSVGASGGLILMWNKKQFTVENTKVMDRAIIIDGQFRVSKKKCAIINIYTSKNQAKRREFFDNISASIAGLELPVILGGDFNVVVSSVERTGSDFNHNASECFRRFIDGNGLIDMPTEGSTFTWFRGGDSEKASKLDRFLVSAEILSWWPNLVQEAGSKGLSDHKAIVLKERVYVKSNKLFKWFSHWADVSDYADLVKRTIESEKCKDMGGLLMTVKYETKAWVNNFREGEERELKGIENRINLLENEIIKKGMSAERREEIRTLKSALWAKFKREEREWAQKSRVRWLKDGNKNTKFFHITASIRRSRNLIPSVKVGNKLVENPGSIAKAFVDYFSENFNKKYTIPMKEFGCKLRKLNKDSANFLESKFSVEEVSAVIKSADGNRAPGPDGFNLDFFKVFWPSLNRKIMRFFEEFYCGGLMDKSLNYSYIALIPKRENPTTMNDYKPILLVGSLYKILARVLSRRLSLCIGEVVGDTQFAFTPGKHIFDCCLIANEVIDDLRRRNKEAIIFKADF
ncbi:hypothetical protein HRI_005048700 [Hibiscus trionum]|uniref:Endonuclease/exonuclease/phosphatase domain-containing protein n=1 Tax=Hibiscus trionum TaxID=183268 RepID=A0A9W7MVU2_HIBTR|nr:hypothetical protein HRI_005048700 [Hibiscus trionum]